MLLKVYIYDKEQKSCANTPSSPSSIQNLVYSIIEDLSPNGFPNGYFEPFQQGFQCAQVMDIDSVGTFTMCHEALKYLKGGGHGRNSWGGDISATLHYTAARYQIHVSAVQAVDSIPRNLALEWYQL
ncbi:hypothetical protein QQP08_022344 [Theobroma cacao]|nr:hypothetical protein QQP08_022344 [Theobroma cacao]